jgi:tetratricopeptide (TPR) repeat protein
MNHGSHISVWDISQEPQFASPKSNILVRLGLAKPDKPPAPQKIVRSDDLHFSSVVMSPDGGWLLTYAGEGWRLWSLKEQETTAAALALSHAAIRPTFSPDGKWLAAYRVADGKPSLSLWKLTTNPPSEVTVAMQNEYLPYSEESIVFSADGKWLAAVGHARLWQLGDEGPVGEPTVLGSQNEMFQAVAISGTGRWVAASSNQTIHVWDREAKDPAPRAHVLRGHEQHVERLAFSPDGAWLASASQDGDVRLWNVASDQIQDTVIVLRASGDQGRRQWQTLLFDPHARWLAAKGYNDICFWRLDAGALVDIARQVAAREFSSEELDRYRLNTPELQRDRTLRLAAAISGRLEQEPNNLALLSRRIDLYAFAGEFQPAIEDLRKWIELEPDNHWPYYCLLTFLAQTNQAEEFRRVGESMTERFREPLPENREILERVAKGRLFWADCGADWEEVAMLADRALAKAAENDHWVMPWAHIAKGLAEYRRGNYADAIEWSDMALTSGSATVHSVAVPANFVKAVAHAHLNEPKKAEMALAAAKKAQAAETPPSKNGPQWNDWYMGEVMLREAEATLLTKAPPQSAANQARAARQSGTSAKE